MSKPYFSNPAMSPRVLWGLSVWTTGPPDSLRQAPTSGLLAISAWVIITEERRCSSLWRTFQLWVSDWSQSTGAGRKKILKQFQDFRTVWTPLRRRKTGSTSSNSDVFYIRELMEDIVLLSNKKGCGETWEKTPPCPLLSFRMSTERREGTVEIVIIKL